MNIFQKKREEIEITQEQLAQMLATDRSTVAKWETGKSFPRPSILVKLTKVFGCTTDELLGIEKKPIIQESGQAGIE